MKRIAMFAVLLTAMIVAGCQTGSPEPQTELGAMDARETELKRAINVRYENPEAHYELGKIYHQRGRLERAEFHYNVAIGFDPSYRHVQASLVRLMVDRQQAEQARNVAEMYINQAAVNADAMMALGRGFHRENLHDYALRCYNKAAEISPNSAPIFKQLGYFYLSKNDKVRSEQNLRRSFEIDPNQPDVAADLGRMGVQVRVPPRKSTGVFGPLRTQEDETIK